LTDFRDLLAAEDLSLTATLLLAVLGFLLALWATPVARAAAIRFGIVDQPDGRLKQQREPVPYLGGLAVFLAVLVSLLLVFSFDRALLALLLSGSLVLILGLIDDLGVLTPRVKFLGQLLAVWVLIKADVMIHIASLPLWFNVLATGFWMVAVMNAINIIDIMDGLAAAVAAVAAGVLVVVALLNEMPIIAAASAALFGACLGFLCFNRAPARIYLGDAGSLFIGLMLGGLTMVLRYGDKNQLAILNPLLILVVPLFDTAFVSAIRMYRGDSPFRGSPDHFALRLRKIGWPVNRIVAAAAGAGVLFGIIAVINLELSWPESVSLYSVTAALVLGVATWLARIRMP
jgi:UDP-GlcNAc:undecaprenyl-phosphate GlcNAc-1-phosphate transferase